MEIDLALGGVSLHEAVEALAQAGVTLEGGADAGALLVSWWTGVTIGCIVTAAIGDKIIDVID